MNIGDVDKEELSKGDFLECEKLGENYERGFLKMKFELVKHFCNTKTEKIIVLQTPFFKRSQISI